MLAGQTAHSLHRSPGRNGAALQPWRSACRRCRLHSTRRRLLAVAQRPRCANEAGGEAHAWRQRAGALAAALCLAAHAPALAGEVVRTSAGCTGRQPTPVAGLAGLLDFGDPEPSDPFTVFGSVRKKYLIEQRAGEKIVSRAKGFTVDACAEGVAVAADALQFPPNRPSPAAAEEGRCQTATGPELPPACASACRAACGGAVERYAAAARAATGFAVADDARARAARVCSRECVYECNKPGKFYSFEVSARR